MQGVYGVGIRKGGQGKSTTVSTLARLCALSGARVLVVDLAQPGTTTASLRDIWIEREHGELADALLACQAIPAGTAPSPAQASDALRRADLPVTLASQPSWSGGLVRVLPWDEVLADAAAYLHSERVLEGLLAAVARDVDLVLIDYPAEGGPLLTNALVATHKVIIPLVPETPALEGVEGMLRLMARARTSGHQVELGGIVLTRCEPRNKRMLEIVQTIADADEVEGEPIDRKLFPFAIRNNEFYEQAFRYGEPIWERTSNPAHWAGYVLLAEWLLADAGLHQLATVRRGPTLLPPDTRILDVTTLLYEPEVLLDVFRRAHAGVRL